MARVRIRDRIDRKLTGFEPVLIATPVKPLICQRFLRNDRQGIKEPERPGG